MPGPFNLRRCAGRASGDSDLSRLNCPPICCARLLDWRAMTFQAVLFCECLQLGSKKQLLSDQICAAR